MAKQGVEGKKEGKASGHPGRQTRPLSANMEDYIEAIYQLSKNGGDCRVSAIAEALGVKRPSVSKALKRLQKEGLVLHLPYGNVRVTPQGQKVAERQVRNHSVLTRFMSEVLGLSGELAEHDACLMEHAISNETVDRLVEFVSHLKSNGATKGKFGNRAPSARKATKAQAARPVRSWRSRV